MQALKHNGIEATLTGDLGRVRNADRLILPGVGAFGVAAADCAPWVSTKRLQIS